jgi:hypothetical protein
MLAQGPRPRRREIAKKNHQAVSNAQRLAARRPN